MRIFWPYILLVCFSCSSPGEQKPNILLLMADDMGWGDAGYNGHPVLETPHLDGMADEGLVFHRFYSAAPVCSPTRGSVLTGRHPFRYGIYYANTGKLPQSELTLSEVLKSKGYTTGHFGKWHLGTLTRKIRDSNRGGKPADSIHYSPPWRHGFDVCFSTEAKVPTWNPMIIPEREAGGVGQDLIKGDFFGTYYWTGEEQMEKDNLEGDDSRVIMDRVIPFIRDAALNDKPFFAVVWFHTPHSPVLTSKKYLDMYPDLEPDQQHYYGTITAMDEQIGRLRHELENLHIDRNTMIWFTSDNGPAAHGGGPGDDKGGRQQGETGGFRERKGSLYEGGIRVPGILVWPEKISKHRETDFPAVTTDYFPTIIDLLGIPSENQAMLDGVSLKDIIESDTVQIRNKPIGFQSRYKGNFMTAWSDNRYKLVSKDNHATFELYDIVNDPYEKNDIASGHPKLVNKMAEELDAWLSTINEEQILDNLYHIDAGKLATLVESDREANNIFQDIKVEADLALHIAPSPIDTIYYEGLIDADPRRVHSKECLKDAPRSENLAWTFLVTREDKYADKAREIILAWSRKHIPLGNPISEKELIPMITAYGLLISHFSDDERMEIDKWLRQIASLEMRVEKQNNWEAKRLWLVGFIGFILEEQQYLDYVQDGYKKYVDNAFYGDGRTNDFIQRDALHYHASGLWPLIDLAIAADRNGIDLESYHNPEGGTLRKCIEFMIPYSNGEKQHAEFVNSKVEFDKIRADVGETEYASGVIFDGLRAAKTYEYYSYFDDSYLPLAFRIKASDTERFSTWKTIINCILSLQEL